MKVLPENKALEKILRIKDGHRRRIREDFEPRAKDCLTCETKGACCLDAHFVNVRVSKPEAMLMASELRRLPEDEFAKLKVRIEDSITRFALSGDPDTVERTYACPLFDPRMGCLVHEVKPVPCVQHACYENEEDLPPESLREEAELEIDVIVRRTYGKSLPLLPIPIAVKNILDGKCCVTS